MVERKVERKIERKVERGRRNGGEAERDHSRRSLGVVIDGDFTHRREPRPIPVRLNPQRGRLGTSRDDAANGRGSNPAAANNRFIPVIRSCH